MRRLLPLVAVALAAMAADRTKYNFNPEWKVLAGDAAGAEAAAFDDSGWKSISLPHVGDQTTGTAWYRKHFKLPAGSAGQKIFLEFEGVRQSGELYLNGKLIGRHEGAMAFGFDITAAVKPAPQENVLAARVANPASNLCGMANVWLHVTSRLHQTLPLYSSLGTTGVYVYAQDFDIAGQAARITAEAQVKNEFEAARTFTYGAIMQNVEGKTIATLEGGSHTLRAGETVTVSASGPVNNLHFWSWGYGYLYTVSTVLKVNGQVVDTVATRTGFRKIEFANGTVKLNDRAILLKGYADAGDWPAAGPAGPPWLSDFSNRMMVDGNGNLVRWKNGGPSKQDVESCDRTGLMETLPADGAGRMRDAMVGNRNNPSVIFYEAGSAAVPEDQMRQMRDQFDPHGDRAMGAPGVLQSAEANLRAMDAMRIPNDNYFANQVMWDGWVDAEHPLVRILGNWSGTAGTKRDVQVVSNAERVELRLNNQSLGNGTRSDHFLFAFPDIAWQEGTLQAIAYDANGRRTATARLDSPGAPAYISLNLRSGHNGLMADGSDLALVDVEVMDGTGRRCPGAANQVRYTVSGPAELLTTQPVENGITRVFLRSTRQAGRIVVQANADGLQLGVIDLISRPVPVIGGLSTEPLGADLMPYLARVPAAAASR